MNKVYIGYDPLDDEAFQVCRTSIHLHSTIPIMTIAVKEHLCRREGLFWRSYRVDDKGQRWDDRDGRPFSSGFAFSRFCVPALAEYEDEWVIYMDPDMLVEGDIAEVFEMGKDRALYCVQHDHIPPETIKMGGLMQTQYARKNWSSFMLLNPSRNQDCTKYRINNETGSWLHALLWLEDRDIGALPEEWNWLEGYSDPQIKPKNIHYTRGTPDIPGCESVMYAKRWFDAPR